MNTAAFKKTALAAAFTLGVAMPALLTPPPAQAGAVVGATEITQILNNVQLVLSYIEQANQLAQQIQMYENMLINTATLPSQVWGNVVGDLQQVAEVVKVGQGLAYTMANIDDKFKELYPAVENITDFKGQYKKWSQANMDTIRGTIGGLQKQASSLETENGLLEYLRAQSGSAQGQVKALQVGHEIAEQQIQQLQKLRAIMIQQAIAQNQAQANQQQQKDADKENSSRQLQYRDYRTSQQASECAAC